MIKALGLDVGTGNGKVTLTEVKSLAKNSDGDIAHDAFSYSSVAGMLLHLSGHS